VEGSVKASMFDARSTEVNPIRWRLEKYIMFPEEGNNGLAFK
jgi:hypothetical protein